MEQDCPDWRSKSEIKKAQGRDGKKSRFFQMQCGDDDGAKGGRRGGYPCDVRYRDPSFPIFQRKWADSTQGMI
jgi:hypothetical protein